MLCLSGFELYSRWVPLISRSKSVEMGVKGIEMSSLYGKVFNKTISLIIESSCEKLFITRTFIQASSVMNVCDAFSRTKRFEMDVKATEKS